MWIFFLRFFLQCLIFTGDDNSPIDGTDGECNEPRPSCGDYVMHFLTLFWKIIFAFIPPTGKFHPKNRLGPTRGLKINQKKKNRCQLRNKNNLLTFHLHFCSIILFRISFFLFLFVFFSFFFIFIYFSIWCVIFRYLRWLRLLCGVNFRNWCGNCCHW